MASSDKLIKQAEALLGRLERLLPRDAALTDWGASTAYRWRKSNSRGHIEPVRHVHRVNLKDLQGIDTQKELVERNTRQFVEGHPANNVLLTGARGTGKSSLIKALLNKYADRGLRLIEVEKHDLAVTHAEKAVELEPQDTFNWTALSTTYQRAFEATRDRQYIFRAEDAKARAAQMQWQK